MSSPSSTQDPDERILAEFIADLEKRGSAALEDYVHRHPHLADRMRGLVGMGDIDEQVDPQQWNEYVRKSQDSLRVIAEETGGLAVVNQNDFSKALKRIDAETSDYYILGYYSKNPDATKRRRQVVVKITRKGANAWFRKEYVLKPPPAPASTKK